VCLLLLQDKAVKAKIDAKNQLETYIYSVKSTVEDKAKVRRAAIPCYTMLQHTTELLLAL
jgi:molecular chaperone DnaK (HSP70)